ncbi:MAG TPA: serine/threonine-protein kinase [Terriglobales bacterium]|nr:serine/threonine-protein kinase [Terriglobales bacterium]
MQAERWRRIEDLFHAALQQEKSRRAAFLTQACAGDEDLRRELEALLARHDEAAEFLEAPAVELAAQTLADEPGAVAASSPSGPVPGARIASRYRILERLGRGGMGVVYKAEDTRLRRHVALKFLPGDVARDARALARFRHEARSASALNHPNICTIYDVDEAAGETFITMEFLDGRTLSDRLAGRPLPPGLLVTWAEQIAEGLAAAHAAGIIHRDIKPANLFVTKQGRAKILDFGLAKPGAILDTAAEPPGEGPTLTSLAQWTQPGAVVGTVAYMSPEQLQALPLDARTDLFSFGAVLYEMATGVRAFPGGVPALVQDAILHRVPDPSRSLNPALPAEIERVIAKALEKDRNLRYQTAAEIRADLQRLRREMDSVGLPVAAGATARRLHRRTFLAAAALIVAAAAAGYLHWRRTPPLTDQDTVVLADFANQTGDPVFDGTLRQGLSVSLEQSPFLGVVSDDQIQQTLRLMGRPPETKLTPAVAREICQRTAGAAVLEGAIARIGDQYLLTLRAVNCASGRSLASAAATAADENHVLAALSSLSRAMRNKLGESLGTVEKFDAPLEQATTPSLEALQAFSSGIRVIDTQGSDAAIPFFQRAVALDPHFALAYAYLGIMENDVLETGKAAEYERKAYELRDRTSEVERDSITVTYHGHVTGNLEKAEQACALWLQAYPRAYHAHDVLAGMILPALGQYDRAAAEAAAAIRLRPDFTVAYAQRMWAEIALGRIDAARAVYAQAQARRLENPMLDIGLYEIAFLRNDPAGMARQVAKNANLPGFEDQFLNLESDTAAYAGRLRDARELSARAIAAVERAGLREPALVYSATAGLREAWFGNPREARRYAAAALQGSPGRDILYLAALAFAYSGDDARAQTLAAALQAGYPQDTLVQFNFLPTLRAKLALDRGDPASAIASLQAAAPYELAISTRSPFNWTAMFPVYVRGEAYLAAGDGSKAAAEFQKILAHPGIVLNEPIAALARLQLGRAFVLAGDAAQAADAYRGFLALWRAADPGIPVFRQAQAEYAKLEKRRAARAAMSFERSAAGVTPPLAPGTTAP